ncbi:putative RNA-directed DNA polymerase [Tanacetum coccineum]
MSNFLYAKNKINFLDGTIKKPEIGLTKYKPWMRCDAMIKGWLTKAMEKTIRDNVKYVGTTSEMWSDLQERFGKENALRAYELKLKIAATRQDGSSVSTYYTRLRALWDESQSIRSFPRCSCDGCSCELSEKIVEHVEKERLYEFLMGLDNDFNVIKTQILATKPIPTLGTAYHMVKEGKENDECTECRKSGHKREGCFKLVGYPDWLPGKKGDKAKPMAACVDTGASPILGISDEQYKLFMNFFSGVGSKNDVETKLEANLAGNRDNVWVVNSGCTEYITHQLNLLMNQKRTSNEAPVVIPNGSAILVMGRGEFSLPGGAKINGVLYVPNFKYNLLSVSRLSNDL